MRHQQLTVALPHGLHAQVAALLVERAADFSSSVFLTRIRTGETASLARVIDLIALGVHHGDEVVVLADGTDAAAALASVVAVLASPSDDATALLA
ncbi:HPr family phosphocarrier protein [Luteococcus peritonei]|uniref:HPr family phosphocarrier protein n=1 Tax=Luteococcus peritonei TaxID=88874 RepID=A0ABW4RZW7_9ACTN